MSFALYADKTQLTILDHEPVTSGSQQVCSVRFTFSDDWDGMTKIACFRSGVQVVSVMLDESGECQIPWEVIDPDDAGKKLFVGVYGTRDDGAVLPSIEICLGVIQKGASCGTVSRPPTPGILNQILELLPKPMTSEQLQDILKIGGNKNDS